MVYYKRNYRRNYGRKRYSKRCPPQKSNTSSYASMAKTALQTAKWVASMINVEFKHHDISVNSTISNSGSITLLNNVPQGDTTQSRDGNSVKMKGLDVNFLMERNSSATYTYVRMIVFMDKQYDGSLSTSNEILDNLNILSHRNITNGKRYYVYSDQTYTLNNQRPSVESSKHISTNAHVRYNAGGGIASNAIQILFISNEGTNTPLVAWRSRMRYIDN